MPDPVDIEAKLAAMGVAEALDELKRFGLTFIGVSRAVPTLRALYTLEIANAALYQRGCVAEARVAELHTALMAYGRHNSDCTLWIAGGSSPCSCGLSDALRDAKVSS